MELGESQFSKLMNSVKSWFRQRNQPTDGARDFWMPDRSCKVCYECDSRFSTINRRHHCRLCGRIFCATCTANSVPFPYGFLKKTQDDGEKIRVCTFCFMQLEKDRAADDYASQSYFTPSSSATSWESTKSSGPGNSGATTSDSRAQQSRPSELESEDQGKRPEARENDSRRLKGDKASSIDPIDLEDNGFLWLPPDPEHSEDESEAVLSEEDASLQGGRETAREEHTRTMKRTVEISIRNELSQLLASENSLGGEEDDTESWLEIILRLSREAVACIKPYTGRGSDMDPGEYLTVKCIACGRRSGSTVVKGIACRKNVAHRRMKTRIENARLLLLGGALEYQRSKNSLSRVDALLHQETFYLKIAVAKISSQSPNVVLVEKSVSRLAQNYLLEKDISLVINVKRPLLERIARCSGASIAASVDTLSPHNIGFCGLFNVEQGRKTLMFFDECPKPLGCTVLLKGADAQALKRVKSIVKCIVVAAYQLALETSFLADEGASESQSPVSIASPLTFGHQSILVSLLTRSVSKETVCERSISRIRFYGSSDKPLGRFLKGLLDQGYRCEKCRESSQLHVRSYTHHHGSVTMYVKKLTTLPLPGEKNGKIWIWHRCQRCPRVNRMPPATQRVLMSDATSDLSFARFLELSFSTHKAVCAHSLHRDCLRFYGYGKMVACFRFDPVRVHSVHLPPPKVDFHHKSDEWVQKEANEVAAQAAQFFAQVHEILWNIQEKKTEPSPFDLGRLTVDLLKENAEFQESFRSLRGEEREGNPTIDILELNKLRRRLLFQCYVWDKRLVNATVDDDEFVGIPSCVDLFVRGGGAVFRDFFDRRSGGVDWVNTPFQSLYQWFNGEDCGRRFGDASDEYRPAHLSSVWEVGRRDGATWLLPVGVIGAVIPVYDDEPTSIVAYALTLSQYHSQTTNNGHVSIWFSGKGSLRYSVICYCAEEFDRLRKTCCPSEFDFIRSISRCENWAPQGGKSSVFFAKSLDDRFVVKQLTKTELQSFLRLAPEYFNHLAESFDSGFPSCLAKILGLYQVSWRKGKMDVLVMENLLCGKEVERVYDLKGSTRSRYSEDQDGVLLDENLIRSMPARPIYLSRPAKRLLARAVWNDTAFLSRKGVMDYSLLVGEDEERGELVVGMIDFVRQYTWDKRLETGVKASGILGGPRNASPTIVSPDHYKRRFREAMASYFFLIPDPSDVELS